MQDEENVILEQSCFSFSLNHFLLFQYDRLSTT